ncbi:hypothetical protein R6V09_31225, partial [Streptomyces sp. W16]|nr:hypothetical protein [Streptomyces sp. W16]
RLSSPGRTSHTSACSAVPSLTSDYPGTPPALGIALLGSLLASTFRDRLDVTGLPAKAADTAGESVVAAHIVAQKTGSADLISSANSAYVHGMGLVLLVCGAAALVTALLAAAFLPNTPAAPAVKEEEDPATAVAVALADAGQ